MSLTQADLDLAQSLVSGSTGTTAGNDFMPRGLRNRNPGNIVKTKSSWDGEVEGEDSRFKSFETDEDGLAAIGSNLLAYNDKHGLDTVSGIINRWAPSSENDTSSYVKSVASSLGVAPDQKIDIRNPEIMAQLSDAIVRKENGKNPYSRDQMLEAARRAITGRKEAADIKRTVTDKNEAKLLTQTALSGDEGGITREMIESFADDMGVSVAEAASIMAGGSPSSGVDFSPAIAAEQAHKQQAGANTEVDWGKKLSASIDSYQANLWSIPAALGSEYALKAMQENKAAADEGFREAGGPQSWNEMEFGKNFGQYFGHLFVQSAPYLAEFVATGFGIGSVLKKGLATTAESIAAKAAAEAVSKGATAAQAAKIGNAAADGFFGTIGGVIGSYPSSTGDVLSNQYEQAGKFNLPAAAALGIPYAALNAAGVEGMMMRGLSRGLPDIAANVAGKGLAGAAGRAAITGAETGLVEGTTETGQEVMNQLGRMSVDPNATLTSGDAPERYKESFIAGSLMGGAMGAAAGPFRKPNSPLTNAANAAGGANAQTQQVPPGPPPGGPQVPVGGQGAAPVGGQTGSPVPGAVPPVDPLTARNDAEIARITKEMADAEARSDRLNSRALENVPDEHLTNVADAFALKLQEGAQLTPEQQRVAENVATEIEFRQMAASEAESLAQQTAVASRFSTMPTAGLTLIARSKAPAAQAARDELQRRSSASTQPTTPAPAVVSTSGVPNNGPATPAAEDAVVAAQGRPGQGDVLPGSPALAPTDGNVQPAPGRDIPAAVAAPGGGTAVPDGATGDGRSPVADENGFIAGPDNYRIRIGEHKAGSNFLDPQADAGALTYEVRKGNNDRSPLNMVVGKSGKLIEAEQALGLDQKSNGVAWIPPTPEAREKAIELLRKRAITKVGSNERKAIDAALTKVVTAPADKTEAAGEPRRGEVGGMVAAGEVVLTSSGRRTTPFPQIKTGPRGTTATVKAVDGWLMQNALDEARSRGDKFNARQFEQNLAKPSQADKDSAEEYLFGQQPDVPRPLLKPLVQQQQAPAEPQPGVTLNDVPPKLMRNLKVPVERLVGDEIKTVEVSANEAIADLDEEIAAYEKLLACVKAAA